MRTLSTEGENSGLRLRALQRQKLEGNMRTLPTEGEKRELCLGEEWIGSLGSGDTNYYT